MNRVGDGASRPRGPHKHTNENMGQRQKTFKTIKALSERWQLSECFIWSLAITGWKAANGEQRLVAKKHYKYAGAMFAEEDIQSWVDITLDYKW